MWGYAVAAGVAAGGMILTQVLKNKSEAEQREILSQAVDEYGNINLPVLERIAAQELGPSEFEKIQADPAFRGAQVDALGELRRVYQSGGRTLEDRSALNDDLMRTGQLERSAREGIRDEMNARGTMGGGSELLMRLKATSDGANRNRQSALQAGAMAQRRASDALLQSGTMAGQMRSQDFAEKARAAEAADARNRFNAAARQQAAAYNAGLGQQHFQNQMQLASGRANARNGLANSVAQSHQGDRELIGGAVQMGGSIAQGYEADKRYDEWLKTHGRKG